MHEKPFLANAAHSLDLFSPDSDTDPDTDTSGDRDSAEIYRYKRQGRALHEWMLHLIIN